MTASVAPTTLQARYHGTARELFPLHLKALLLSLATLGFYRFWGRTLVRRHIWWRVHLLDDGLEYTGTGRELLIGFLKAVAIILPLLILAWGANLFGQLYGSGEASLAQFGASAVLGYLYYVGSYAGRAYRMGRTRWRGVRFRQYGSAFAYGGIMLLGWAVLILTGGLSSPWLSTWIARYETDNLRFGDQAFRFDGRGGDLFTPFMINWVLFLPTLGLSWFWYDARRMRYIAEHTILGGLRFALSPRVGALRLMRLRLGNLIAGTGTLGLLYPLVARRTMRFWCDNLSAGGTLDLAAVTQPGGPMGGGEGMAGFFNVDALGS